MNVWIAIGRLTRDPAISVSASGMKIARYTLACDRRGKREEGQQSADFINCVAFDKSADFADKYLRQGTKILVRAHIQTGRFTGKDGQTVYTTDAIIDDQEFAESKAASSRDSAPTAQAPAAGQSQSVPGFTSIPDSITEDVPFA